MKIKIECHYDNLLSIDMVKENPKNVNIHPDIQLKGLEKTLKENSIRHPLIISKRSGLLVAGHARLAVMKKLKMKKVPVTYQGFESEEKEFQFMVADNESQRMSWLDPEKFNLNIEEMGIPDLKLENFGIFDELEKDVEKITSGTQQEKETQDNQETQSQETTQEEIENAKNNKQNVDCIHVYIEEDYDKVIETLEHFKKKNEPTTYSKIFLDALRFYKKSN